MEPCLFSLILSTYRIYRPQRHKLAHLIVLRTAMPLLGLLIHSDLPWAEPTVTALFEALLTLLDL